jgi:NDP-sugar pyrophosphorylase family protein
MPNGKSNQSLSDISALVLAGGFGTRSKPVLGETPKLLAPLADRPFLDYLMAWLKSFGLRQVTLSLGHLADQIIDYVDAHPYRDMEVKIVIESEPLGTAGAIAFARQKIASSPVLVLNGDSYVSADLQTFYEFHVNGDFDASLICTEVPDAARFGRVLVDEANLITCFQEKDTTSGGSGLINAGVYLLGDELLDNISRLGKGSIEHDIFSARPQPRLGAFNGKFDFIDFGTPESYAQAQTIFAKLSIPETH